MSLLQLLFGDNEPTFICHGSNLTTHFYSGPPPCPQCEADRDYEREKSLPPLPKRPRPEDE